MTLPLYQAESATPRPPVSVVILTLNQEHNIGACIESCRWCDDLYLLDGGSGDRTRQIAEEMGAKVYVNPNLSLAKQRNWAIDQIPIKHPWQFHLHADEHFTPELVAEMVKELGSDGAKSRYAAYLCPSKLIFRGKWLRFSGEYPTYRMRLFRPDKYRFGDPEIGRRAQCRGEIGSLVQPYLHFSFSGGLKEWLSRCNAQTSRQAELAVQVRRDGVPWRNLVSSDRPLRRQTRRHLVNYVKARALWRFFYLYIMKSGWLDATPGFHYCALMAMREYWIEIKIREAEEDWSVKTLERARDLYDGIGSWPR